MIVVERMVQQIYPGKMAALNEIDKRFDVVEKGLGFPPKKRFSSLSGPLDLNTIVVEREWSSMAEMEEIYARSFGNSEQQALVAELIDIVKSARIELYTPI